MRSLPAPKLCATAAAGLVGLAEHHLVAQQHTLGLLDGVIEWMKKEKKQVKPNLSGNIVVVGAGNTAMDAARFAEAVVGAPYEYEIPAQAFITESDAIAKHGILKMSGKCEGERCLQCSTVCENCVDSCPNRANVAVVMPDESHQIIHVDKMCNECGNCTQFCPYASEPCHDKFTLFQTAEDMAESKNPGVLFLDADHVRVRMAEERDYDLTTSDNDLPVDIEALIFTIRDKYSYLFA